MWKYVGTAPKGKPFEIDNVNVWDFEWITQRNSITVIEPVYSREFVAFVYRIDAPNQTVQFAAAEFPFDKWGFYVQQPGS